MTNTMTRTRILTLKIIFEKRKRKITTTLFLKTTHDFEHFNHSMAIGVFKVTKEIEEK